MDTWPRFITDWRFHLFLFEKKQPFLEWWSSTFFSGGCNHPPELKDNWILGYPIFTQTNLGIIQNLVPRYEMIGRNPEKKKYIDRNQGFADDLLHLSFLCTWGCKANSHQWPDLTQAHPDGAGGKAKLFFDLGYWNAFIVWRYGIDAR